MREATEAVRTEWARRVEAEYRSAAHTQELTLWLIHLGAPRELIEDGLRIVQDELDHAELSAKVHALAGGTQLPTLVRSQLRLPTGGGSLERDVLRVCIETFCLGETVAVPLFQAMRQKATVPAVCETLERVLRDEVRHRQFGWDLLEYLLDTLPEAKGWAVEFIGPLLDNLRKRYDADGEAAPPPSDEALAWGLLPVDRYASIVTATIEREYTPRFAALGIQLRVR
jgi:hypothetical protein